MEQREKRRLVIEERRNGLQGEQQRAEVEEFKLSIEESKSFANALEAMFHKV